MTLRTWSIILAIVAGLDVLTTYLAMSAGGVEVNPAFAGASIQTMALAKAAAIGVIIWLSLHFKQKSWLILITGINIACVVGNIGAIVVMT